MEAGMNYSFHSDDTQNSVPLAGESATKLSQDPSHRILLVEDCPETQFLLSVVLQHLGHEIVVAADATTCLDEVRLAEETANTFDAILVDIGLPGMSGYALSRSLRQMHCDVPIIAITAGPSMHKRARSIHSGCDAFLAKNTIHETIAPTLKRLLEDHAKGQLFRHVDESPAIETDEEDEL